ncbi:MAG TPA: PaaI family thioesterase [Streptomyces sp.]|jgi:uncharacterized protein (TIGR00369 family)|nr:PaaI family thioesterase [Streptomyces sp.]
MTSKDTPSGLEFLHSIIDGRTPRAPISDTLGFDLVAVEEGTAVFEGRTGAHLCNPMGTVHGGYLATLLDSALGCAVLSLLAAGQSYTTAQLNVNLIRPVTPLTGTLRAAATALHVGRTLGTAEARLTGSDDGKLYAHATATCAVFS